MSNALAQQIEVIKTNINVKSRDIARLLKTTPQTVSRWQSGQASPPTERLRVLLTLNFIATQMAEYFTPEEARIWLYRPHPQLGGRSPADLIEDGQIDEVQRLIDRLDAGMFV